jgi:hypothetical protein
MLPLVFAAATAAATAAAVPSISSSPPAPSSPDAAEAPRKVRNGIVVGLAFGAAVGRGAGYPNDLNDIGHTDYASSGWMPGAGGTLLLMGAIADYLNFGFWYAHASFRGGDQRASQDGVGLRVEAFPLVFVCPQVGGLGVFSEFGLGTAKLMTSGAPNASGTQSFIGAGLLYEWAFGHVLGGHFGIGPSLEYNAVFTQPYHQNGLVAGLRAVWYGGP